MREGDNIKKYKRIREKIYKWLFPSVEDLMHEFAIVEDCSISLEERMRCVEVLKTRKKEKSKPLEQ